MIEILHYRKSLKENYSERALRRLLKISLTALRAEIASLKLCDVVIRHFDDALREWAVAQLRGRSRCGSLIDEFHKNPHSFILCEIFLDNFEDEHANDGAKPFAFVRNDVFERIVNLARENDVSQK